MLFTRIPQQYAPLGGELRYAVSQETAGNIDIRIVDAAAGSAAGIGAAVSPGGADRAGTRGPGGRERPPGPRLRKPVPPRHAKRPRAGRTPDEAPRRRSGSPGSARHSPPAPRPTARR